MHKFFQPRDGDLPLRVPGRVYALLADAQDGEYVLYDAVDAAHFDQIYWLLGFQLRTGDWRSHVVNAPIFAIEINASDGSQAARAWLAGNPTDTLSQWAEIELVPDVGGEAAVYDNIAGPAMRATASTRPLSPLLEQVLLKATDLTPEVKPEAVIEQALPMSTIEEIFVLDVGQGSANALVTGAGDVVAYVDLGGGVLADIGTWPVSMGGICVWHDPIIILTHWHYDHFQAANTYPAAQRRTWIAPLQTLGPGPQSAMVSAIAATGTLMVSNGTGCIRTGNIELERCVGSATNQNRSGIAVWIWEPNGGEPILLPGDAGYKDIATIKTGRSVASLACAHHGGSAPGKPPPRPTAGAPRIALSYGHGNSYSHPLTGSLSRLTASGWTIGHPMTGADDRRTEDRPGGVGGSGLGHIRMNWSGNVGLPHACGCGCTLDPTQ